MPRDDLMDILRRIAACPENDGRNIIATARTCTGPNALTNYVMEQWRRLGTGSEKRIYHYIAKMAQDKKQVAA